MQDMQQGGNAPVTAARPVLAFRWHAPEGRGVMADISAYLLTASGKVRSDSDMVFYNQPSGGDGALRFHGEGNGRFEVDLAALPEAVERIAFCLTVDEAQAKGHTLALLDGAEIVVADALRFAPSLAAATEAAMIFGELYRRNGAWKFRAVGQGFQGGLAPLARSFGVDIADPAEPEAPPPPPSVAGRPPKRSLTEPNESIDLDAPAGLIQAELNRARSRKATTGGATLDLDLACLVEMRDGRKGALQAIGALYGRLNAAPFVSLNGDDRGNAELRETLAIAGDKWGEIARILIFANIYDGPPDWQQLDALLHIAIPGGPVVDVALTEGQNDKRICAIALLENRDGRLHITRAVDYLRDQQELDERFGWGVRWKPGAKV